MRITTRPRAPGRPATVVVEMSPDDARALGQYLMYCGGSREYYDVGVYLFEAGDEAEGLDTTSREGRERPA